MKLPAFSYCAPTSVDETCALLREHGDDAKVLAGGQSLLPVMALRLARPALLVDIGGVGGLDGVEVDSDAVSIGARCTHAALERHPIVRELLPALHLALPLIAHDAIRTRGTIGGSLAHNDPAAELPAVALLLRAEMRVRSARGSRTIRAEDFFESYLTTALAPDELLTSIRFPLGAGLSACAVREVARRHGDFALVGAACRVSIADDGVAARVALLGADRVAVAFDVDAAVLGEAPFDDGRARDVSRELADRLDPPEDVHASSDYRRHVAGVLVERVLLEAGAKLGEATR
jgi:CO/xanthine dehydrogenase FAD-binding subunit